MMQTRQVRLTATPTRFISNAADLDAPTEERTLRLPAAVFRQVCALAQEGPLRFRAPKREFRRPQAAAFVAALKAAMGVETSAPLRATGAVALRQAVDYFKDPVARKWLAKVVAFAEAGTGFEVCDEDVTAPSTRGISMLTSFALTFDSVHKSLVLVAGEEIVTDVVDIRITKAADGPGYDCEMTRARGGRLVAAASPVGRLMTGRALARTSSTAPPGFIEVDGPPTSSPSNMLVREDIAAAFGWEKPGEEV